LRVEVPNEELWHPARLIPTATPGGAANITVSWNGLTAGTKYLGRVSYRDGAGEIGDTIVSVNP
jgi:hypothetical protein